MEEIKFNVKCKELDGTITTYTTTLSSTNAVTFEQVVDNSEE